MNKIKKILVANRGEIAIRICRTLSKNGITPVLIYSSEDKNSEHLNYSDEVYELKGDGLKETYLNINQIISIAKKSEVDAIHPGYGFLSENFLFAEEVKKAGLIFIGPEPEAIKLMGNKLKSREIAVELGVPVIPIIKGSFEDIINRANDKDFPFLIKAAAGGGGKGMRIVWQKNELVDELKSASREAEQAFGNGEVYLEKYFEKARHIEVQILGDTFGNIIHLFERECSVQRRYQKIIEETPAPKLPNNVRNKIFVEALKLSKEIKYSSAGTIEFLLDEKFNFYFLEMNTRIQVEHPVTEMTTGIDIVSEQIKIAEGNKLKLIQDDITQNGHSIECRIYAEDPNNDFLPSPGEIDFLTLPESNENIRLDSAIRSPQNISASFDPMIAKLIVKGATRTEAVQLMNDSLNHFNISGIKNNLGFLKNILIDESFKLGEIHTKYCEENVELLNKKSTLQTEEIISVLAGLLISIFQKEDPKNIWELIGRWRIVNRFEFFIEEKTFFVEVQKYSEKDISFLFDNKSYVLNNISRKNQTLKFSLNEVYKNLILFVNKNDFVAVVNGKKVSVKRNDIPTEVKNWNSGIDKNDSNKIFPMMPGKVVDLFVTEGDVVSKGDKLLILEAMKMETVIKAPVNCKIEKVNCSKEDFVNTEEAIIILGGI